MEKWLAVIDETTFEGLADTTKELNLYVKNEKDGQYYFNMSGIEAAKLAIPLQNSVKKLETKNEEVIGEKKALQDELKSFKDLNKTADEIKKVLSGKVPDDINALEEKHAIEIKKIKESSEEELKRVSKGFAEEIETAKKDTGEFQTQLDKEIKSAKIANLQREYDMMPGSEYLLDRAFAVVPVEEGSKTRVIRVLEESGDIAYKASNPMSPEQFVENLQADSKFGHFFGAKGGGGSGGSNNQNSSYKGGGTINANDVTGIAANLEDVATGKIKVV